MRPPSARQVLPSDLTKAAAPVKIEQFVFVEVDVDFPQHLNEAAWVAELAKSDPRLTGMVAALPLEKGQAIEPELEELRKHKLLRAVRRLIQTQPDPDFCIRPEFIEGLKLLAPHDIAFDICIFHHQMPNVIKMVRQCPEVRFVLDHIGKPGIKAGIFDPWRQNLKELAAMPNVHCKISGVTTEADHKNWTREQLKPYIAPHARDIRLRPLHVWRRLACLGACRHLSPVGGHRRLGYRRRKPGRKAQAFPRQRHQLLSPGLADERTGLAAARLQHRRHAGFGARRLAPAHFRLCRRSGGG